VGIEVELGETGGLAYRGAGEGRPLVLLHPGPGLDGSVFFPEVLTLAERGTRVIAFDLPANGRSQPGDPAAWSLAAWADQVAAAIRALGLQPRTYDLLGHSFGGYVALELNKRHPDELRRLIASCTDGSEQPPPGPLPEPPSEPAFEEAEEREWNATTPEELRQAWLDQLDFYAATPEGAERLRERWRGVTYQPGPNRHEEWGELEALDALRDKTVLAIAGEHDRMPRALQQRIADASPHGRLAVIEGAGHFPFAETPERYWGAVEAWLLRTAAGTAA
jgi:pimeloyl-ACP methyl ester carboxylesterase